MRLSYGLIYVYVQAGGLNLGLALAGALLARRAAASTPARPTTCGTGVSGGQTTLSAFRALLGGFGVLGFLFFASARGMAAELTAAQLYWHGRSAAGTLLVGLSGLALAVTLAGLEPTSVTPWAWERQAWTTALVVTWMFVAQCTTLLPLLLCLEVAALLVFLLLSLARLECVTRPTPNLLRRASEQQSLNALILLFWTTALATLVLIWALALGAKEAALGSLGSPSPLRGHLPPLATAAVLLKFFLPPFQLLLLSVYQALPLYALIRYTLAYYLFFLTLGVILLLATLTQVSTGWLWALALLSASTPLVALSLSGNGDDPRQTLGLSTLITLALIGLAVMSA